MESLSYEDQLETAVCRLSAAKCTINELISQYPTPISGCDAQFNRLLSDRSRISNALSALRQFPFIPTPRMLDQPE